MCSERPESFNNIYTVEYIRLSVYLSYDHTQSKQLIGIASDEKDNIIALSEFTVTNHVWIE